MLQDPEQRNIIVQMAVDRLVEARWTDEIYDEWVRNLVANTPTLPIERLQITKRPMNAALPMVTVRGYESHIRNQHFPER